MVHWKTVWIGFIICLLLCSQSCFRMRWKDEKAQAVFRNKSVPLAIYDTVIDGRHIHYAVSSNVDTLPFLVFIHGSPGSWFHYRRFMYDEELRQKFQVIAIDRPGFGYSDFGKALPLKDQTDLIAPVLEKLKGCPVFLVGHSMGGPIVVKLAAENPALFKSVVVVAGAIDVKQEKKERWRHLMGKKGLSWLLPGAYRPSNTELLFLKEDLKYLEQDFAKITCPVVFVHGNKDTWVPIENVAFGQKMMVNAPSIRSDTIYGADHQIPWKNYAALKKILVELE